MFGNLLRKLKSTSQKKKLNKTTDRIISSLAEQKTSKRKHLRFSLVKKIQYLSYFTVFFVFSFLVYKNYSVLHSYIFGVEKSQLQISIHFDNHQENEASLQAKQNQIISFVAEEIKSFSFKDMKYLSKAVQSKFDLEEVRVSRVGLQHVMLNLLGREAVLKIKMDEIRLLSSQGKIYGHENLLDSNLQLPILSGIFEDSPYSLAKAEDGSYILAQDQKQRILEALDLYSQLNHKKTNTGTEIQEIRFDRFRGFRTLIHSTQSEILFGRSPFTDKIKRYKKLKEELEKQNKSIERLELDYVGKAFLKERSHKL